MGRFGGTTSDFIGEAIIIHVDFGYDLFRRAQTKETKSQEQKCDKDLHDV